MTLWHKPTEKPRRKEFIIFNSIDDYNKYLLFSSSTYEVFEKSTIKKWCYLSDLLKAASKAEKLEKELKDLKLDYVHQGRLYGELIADYEMATKRQYKPREEY